MTQVSVRQLEDYEIENETKMWIVELVDLCSLVLISASATSMDGLNPCS